MNAWQSRWGNGALALGLVIMSLLAVEQVVLQPVVLGFWWVALWRMPSRWLVGLAYVWAILMTAGVMLAMASSSPAQRATVGMGALLLVIWGGVLGPLMLRWREPVAAKVRAWPIPLPLQFLALAAAAALLEEAVTVSLTNAAPWLGVPVGAAYITASANYLDVVFLHSVVVFVPMFAVWGVFVQCYAVTPWQVMTCFGVTGMVCEFLYGGPLALAMGGFWLIIYGWMVFLPAWCVMDESANRRPLRGWHVPLLVIAPILAAIPVALLVHAVHPVKVHFPPIR